MKKYFAELLGTMVLVLIGCGTAVFSGVDLVATSLAFGLSVVAMAYTIGGFSGCHINPAITLAAWVSKRISSLDALMYMVFQFAGLAIGLTLVLVHLVCIGITGTSVNPARSIGPALLAGGAALEQLWIFVVAPFVGALLSALVWKCFTSCCDCKKK